MAKTETITIKVKVGKLENSIEAEYTYPETWAEACEMDTESKAFKTYLTERKTNFMDKVRTKEKKKLEKGIAELLSTDSDLKAKLEALMG